MDATKPGLTSALMSLQAGKPTGASAKSLATNAASTQGAKGFDLAKARKAAEDFEAVFLSQMLSHMFEGIKTDKMFGGGPGEDMFKTMMVQEYGKEMARSGGIGVADAVMREMIKIQEASAK